MGLFLRWSRQFPGQHRLLFDTLLLGALTMLYRAPFFHQAVAFDSDESIFSLAARDLLEGHLPYDNFFDIKPIGSTLLVSAFYAVFGQSTFVLRFVGDVCVWISAVLLGRLATFGGLSRLQSFMAGCTFILFSTTLNGVSTGIEIMLAPFSILALLLLTRAFATENRQHRRVMVAAAGVACGLAILLKLVPIITGTAALLYFLARTSGTIRARALLAFESTSLFFAGALFPIATTAVLYGALGRIKEFTASDFSFIGHYMTSTVRTPTAIEFDLAKTAFILSPLAVLGLIAIWRVLKTRNRRTPTSDLVELVSVWTLAELCAACASLQFFTHYFIMLLAPLSLLAAFGVRATVEWLNIRRRRTFTIAISLLACGYAVPQTAWARAKIDQRDAYIQQAAADIRRSSPGRRPTLFVAEEEEVVLYSLTDAAIPSKYFIPIQLFSSYSSVLDVDPLKVVSGIVAGKPRFIVVGQLWEGAAGPAAAVLREALCKDYRVLSARGGIVVYESATPKGAAPGLRDRSDP